MRGAVALLYDGWCWFGCCCCGCIITVPRYSPTAAAVVAVDALVAAVDTLCMFFCRMFTSCTQCSGKKPDRLTPRTKPSSKPQSVEPTTSITSPGWMLRWPSEVPVYGCMHTTVVLGWPIEQAALSELVPTPDESLMMSLVSPMLLSAH